MPQRRLGRNLGRADAYVTTVILCECAIDAISCLELYPSCLCVSTSGARASPSWLCSLICERREIYCGFDADSTGEAMASNMMALHPEIRRLRPSQHDWNDVLKQYRSISMRRSQSLCSI